MAYWIRWRRTIGISDVETFLSDRILKRYIEIGSIEPLVVDNISRKYVEIGSVEPIVVDILISFGVRGYVL